MDHVSTPYDLLTAAQVESPGSDEDRIFDRIGLELRDHPGALERFAAAGARIEGTRVRFEPGLARAIPQCTAPRSFTQRVRNHGRGVVFGGRGTVTARAAAPPMARARDGIRRYGRLEDFPDFARLAQASDAINHAGAVNGFADRSGVWIH